MEGLDGSAQYFVYRYLDANGKQIGYLLEADDLRDVRDGQHTYDGRYDAVPDEEDGYDEAMLAAEPTAEEDRAALTKALEVVAVEEPDDDAFQIAEMALGRFRDDLLKPTNRVPELAYVQFNPFKPIHLAEIFRRAAFDEEDGDYIPDVQIEELAQAGNPFARNALPKGCRLG